MSTITEAPVTLNLRCSPTELTLLAALLNDKIAWLDAEWRRVQMIPFSDEAETVMLMRALYVAMVRRIEQLLDVPFVDAEAVAAVPA